LNFSDSYIVIPTVNLSKVLPPGFNLTNLDGLVTNIEKTGSETPEELELYKLLNGSLGEKSGLVPS